MATETQDASELNRELTDLLYVAGQQFGFVASREYPVKGGRLDVVWAWTPPSQLPGLDQPVPVVGFEIESSWRTRKHVKGDLLNLQDAGVALGVIVLAGGTEKDESLRRFAAELVDRPGANILIWTASDVRGLTAGGSIRHTPSGLETLEEIPLAPHMPAGSQTVASPPAAAASSHVGKYSPLHRWLSERNVESFPASFTEVEEVLGFPLPSSCRNHVPHWHSYAGSAVARAIADAGWKASLVDLSEETLVFVQHDPLGNRGSAP